MPHKRGNAPGGLVDGRYYYLTSSKESIAGYGEYLVRCIERDTFGPATEFCGVILAAQTSWWTTKRVRGTAQPYPMWSCKAQLWRGFPAHTFNVRLPGGSDGLVFTEVGCQDLPRYLYMAQIYPAFGSAVGGEI